MFYLFPLPKMSKVFYGLALVCLLFGCTKIQQVAKEFEATEVAQDERTQKIQNANLDNPEYVLSVQDIANEFSNNSVTAENKYMDRVVELSGTIGSIDDSLLDESNATVSIRGDEYSLSSVSCNVRRNSEAAQVLQKGMNIVFRGVVTSEDTGIEMSRCNFWISDENRWIT